MAAFKDKLKAQNTKRTNDPKPQLVQDTPKPAPEKPEKARETSQPRLDLTDREKAALKGKEARDRIAQFNKQSLQKPKPKPKSTLQRQQS